MLTPGRASASEKSCARERRQQLVPQRNGPSHHVARIASIWSGVDVGRHVHCCSWCRFLVFFRHRLFHLSWRARSAV